MFGVRSGHGVVVNEDTSMGVTAYWRATNIIAGTIAMLPLSLREKLPDGSNRPAKNHNLYNLLHAEPSKKHTSFVFRRMIQEHLCYRGNGYAIIFTDGTGKVNEIRFLDSRQVHPFEQEDEIWYRIFIKNKTLTLHSDQVIHIQGPGSNGLIGKNPIEVHRESIGEAIAVREYGTGFYANGGHISGVLEHPKRLSQEAANRIEGGFAQKYGGLQNAGKIAVLEEGMQYKTVGITPEDANFIESRNYGVQQIARITGVPAHMLGDLERATFNNIEHLSTETVRYTFLPWLVNWEQEFNRKLLTPSERERYYVHFNVEGLLRGDTEARAKYYTNMFGIGAISPNDARRKEDMNPIEGGDRYFVPINNVAPLDMIDQILLQNQQKPSSNEA